DAVPGGGSRGGRDRASALLGPTGLAPPRGERARLAGQPAALACHAPRARARQRDRTHTDSGTTLAGAGFRPPIGPPRRSAALKGEPYAPEDFAGLGPTSTI